MEAITNNHIECAVRLLVAGARIMVPMNHFEDCTVTSTSMLHQIIYAQAYLEDMRDTTHHVSDNAGRLLLTIMLLDLLDNPKRKYSWAQQESIPLFRTVIGEDSTKSTDTQMRTP